MVSLGVVAVVADEFDDAVAGAAVQFGSVVGVSDGVVGGAAIRFVLVVVLGFAVSPDVGAGAGVWAG